MLPVGCSFTNKLKSLRFFLSESSTLKSTLLKSCLDLILSTDFLIFVEFKKSPSAKRILSLMIFSSVIVFPLIFILLMSIFCETLSPRTIFIKSSFFLTLVHQAQNYYIFLTLNNL